MHTSRVLGFLGAGAIVALSACSSDSTGPSDTLSDQQMSADVAASSAPAVATSAALFAQAEAAGSTLASVVPSVVCSTHSASGVIAVSQSESHPDTIAYSATWEYFAAGACQNSFAAASTDSIAFAASLLEVDNDPRFVARATRTWALDVIGNPTLASATTHVWNATGLDADTAEHKTSGLDRTYTGTAYDTATNVTFPNPRNGSLVPSSGTLSRWVSATVTHTTHGVHKVATVSRHIVVTFNGQTQIPLDVFDAMRGTRLLACTLDLTARRIIDGSCH